MDLGKVTVFSGSAEGLLHFPAHFTQIGSCYDDADEVFGWNPLILDNTCARRSPSCAKMTPANPTMKGLEL